MLNRSINMVWNDLDNIPVYIFSDSHAVVKALGRFKFTLAVTVECHDTLQLLAAHRQVTLAWVPGHMGNAGNESVNELARKGSVTPLVGRRRFGYHSYDV